MPPEAIVIYDDDCGFCRWSLALLLSVAFGALRPLPLGTSEADYLLHDLTVEDRQASWHLVFDPPSNGSGPDQLSFDAAPARFSAGAAFVPALSLLPRGRRLAWLVARMPDRTERGYRWVAEHRGLLGRFVPGRARDWADQVIAAHGGPARP